MYRPVYTRQFKEDIEKAKKQGKDIEQFKLIAHTLLSGKPLDPIFRDHKLVGNYKGRSECHVKSDWLLIYEIEEDRLIFERIGSHAELFTD